jgi:hypothetical protein
VNTIPIGIPRRRDSFPIKAEDFSVHRVTKSKIIGMDGHGSRMRTIRNTKFYSIALKGKSSSDIEVNGMLLL